MEIKCIKLNEMIECVCQSNLKVKYLLPNETAHFNIPKDRIVRQEHVIEKASDRTHVRCPIFYECGGCDFLHMTYESQLKMKQAYIQDLFVSNDVKVKVSPVMRSEQPFHYRHKVVLSATTSKKKLRLGLYRENSKQVIPFLDCFIQDKKVNDVMKTVEEVLNKYKIPAYDIDLESGIIKHVLIRKSHAEKTMLLVFVTHGNLLPNAKKMAQEIVKKHPLVQGVVQNIHNKKTRLVLLDDEKTIYGKTFVLDEIDGIRFRISSKSFYQVNPIQMINLYQKAIELAEIKKDDIVVDAYSGIGTISLLVAKHAKAVIAVEVNSTAHLDAVQNKRINIFDNVIFKNEDVESFMQGCQDRIDVLMMDPTRDGLSKAFIDAVLEMKPKKIVYISCEVKTQVRDLKHFMHHYQVTTVQPLDMFSQTAHTENIAVLELKKAIVQ